MDLGPYCRTFQPDASSATHTYTHKTRICVCLEYAKLTFLFFFYLFWDFLMYFDIFGFVLPKKYMCHQPPDSCCYLLKMASLDHSELTRVPQVDISSL